MLQILGVEPVDATRYVCSLRNMDPTTFMEVYGQGRMIKMANDCRNLNLRGLNAMDLRTCKPDGQPWDFRNPDDRSLAERLVLETEPTWLIGWPPCVSWCTLNQGLNYPKMDPAKIHLLMTEARLHLDFVCRPNGIHHAGIGLSTRTLLALRAGMNHLLWLSAISLACK